jgi:hypothetical protein
MRKRERNAVPKLHGAEELTQLVAVFEDFRASGAESETKQMERLRERFDLETILQLRSTYERSLEVTTSVMFSDAVIRDSPYEVGSDDGHTDAAKYIVTHGSVECIQMFVADPLNNECVKFINGARDIEEYHAFDWMDAVGAMVLP